MIGGARGLATHNPALFMNISRARGDRISNGADFRMRARNIVNAR
jgi:hypothetical protein